MSAPLELPDVPRWVEAHGIAADPEAWRAAVGAGFALGHDVARLLVVAGDADPAATASIAAGYPHHTVLCAIEREDLAVALRAAGRSVDRAILHTLTDPAAVPDHDGATPISAGTPLPSPLAEELEWARRRGPVWSVWVDGQPVSFAYAPWRSAAWFDISVDTLPGSRQLGLATIVAAAMIRDERSRGREPVWGADEGNVASLRLARRLGFEPTDELWIAAATRAGAGG